MKRDFYTTPKSSALMRLFWKAAGADRYILERATYSDQIKYTCLGGIVVSTGVMAGIAGGYGFYTIFGPRGSALTDETSLGVTIGSMLFGIIWGLIIFNIDRFIVTSTGTGDGTEAITADEIKGALPRIIMGMIIALTISKPVEIRMFKSEIDVELHSQQKKLEQKHLAQIDSLYAGRIQDVKNRIERWEDEIKEKVDRAAALEDQYIEEARNVTVGPRARAVKEQWDRASEQEKLVKEKNTPLIESGYEKLKDIEKEKQKEIDNSQVVASGLDGLLERIKLAHEIAGFWISLFITLLFMAIELTPIFFKLMLIKSPYDFLSDNIKELVKAERGIEVKYDYYQDKEGKERDLVIFHEAKRLINDKAALAEAQKELSSYAISKWVEKQKALIDENPERYVQSEDVNSDPSES